MKKSKNWQRSFKYFNCIYSLYYDTNVQSLLFDLNKWCIQIIHNLWNIFLWLRDNHFFLFDDDMKSFSNVYAINSLSPVNY